jgi:hypothetical protein
MFHVFMLINTLENFERMTQHCSQGICCQLNNDDIQTLQKGMNLELFNPSTRDFQKTELKLILINGRLVAKH